MSSSTCLRSPTCPACSLAPRFDGLPETPLAPKPLKSVGIFLTWGLCPLAPLQARVHSSAFPSGSAAQVTLCRPAGLGLAVTSSGNPS